MASELVGAIGFLDQRLTQDSTLQALVGYRIYLGSAPQTDPDTDQLPTYPLVLARMQSARNALGMPGARILTTIVFRVVAIGNSQDVGALARAASRIDSLLTVTTPTNITVDGVVYTVSGSIQLAPYERGGVEDGIYYQQLGGDYQIHVQPVA